MSGWIVGAVALPLVAAMAVASRFGMWAVLGVAGVLVLCLALGWPLVTDLPERIGSGVVIGATGAVGLLVAVLARPTALDPTRPLNAYGALLAAAVLVCFAHELARRDPRTDVVESLAGTLTGQILALLCGGWVLLAELPQGGRAVLTAVAAVGVAQATVGALAAARPTQDAPPGLRIWGPIFAGGFGAGVATVIAAWLLNAAAARVGALFAAVLAGALIGAIAVAMQAVLPAVPPEEPEPEPGQAGSPTGEQARVGALTATAVRASAGEGEPGFAAGAWLGHLTTAAMPMATAGSVVYCVLQFAAQ